MTLQEGYAMLHGNYEDAKSRLAMDKLIERFLLKFPEDPSMELLRTSAAKGNVQEAFRAAHTLKGVAANLAFTELMDCAAELTEQLRSGTEPVDPVLYQKVEAAYEQTIKAIESYKHA